MVQSKIKDDCLWIYLKDEIDHCVSLQLREEIDSLISSERIKRLHLDFSKVTFIDSSGIGMIIGRYKTMKEKHGTVSASGMNDMVYRLFRLAGLHRIIPARIDGGECDE